MNMDGHGRTWTDMDEYGRTWTDMDEYGRTWMDMGGVVRMGYCESQSGNSRG
jgi:hypothetical protein